MATISEIPGFVEVMFHGEKYRVFETDLLRNCDTEVTGSSGRLNFAHGFSVDLTALEDNDHLGRSTPTDTFGSFCETSEDALPAEPYCFSWLEPRRP